MKSKINFIIDVILLLLMSIVAGIGILIKYILIPGKDRVAVYGKDVDLYLLGWDRHQWGALHVWLGFFLMVLVVLHIVLHWKQVCVMASNLIKNNVRKYVLSVFLAILCIFFTLFPFLVSIDVKEGSHEHGQIKSDHEIVKGFMTLKEVSIQNKIPIDYLKSQLSLPNEVNENETLSQLRQKYNIDMHKIREIISNYKVGKKN